MSEQDSGLCHAPGCFLRPAFKAGSGNWKCYFHQGATGAEQDSVTARMNNRRELILLALRLTQENYGATLGHGRVAAAQQAGVTAATADMSSYKAGQAMLSALYRQCRHPQQQTGAGPADLKAAAAGDMDW